MPYNTIMTLVRWIKEKWLLVAAFAAVSLILFFSFYHPYSGPDIIEAPIQRNLPRTEMISYPGREGPVPIIFLASYKMTAAVKSKMDYSTDYVSQVSPTDLVLAWNDLNKREINKHIRYSQFNRWYTYEYYTDAPVSKPHIQESSANVHLIPSDERVAAQIKKIRKNDLIEIEGYLAEVKFDSGSWISSLSRQDEGDHSCEILYVTDISIK